MDNMCKKCGKTDEKLVFDEKFPKYSKWICCVCGNVINYIDLRKEIFRIKESVENNENKITTH